MTGAAAVEAAVADAHRRDWGRVLAATARVARDLDLAEECVQEAYASALQAWVRAGIPGNPAAWLTTTARRRAIDALRRDTTLRSRLPLLVEPGQSTQEVAMDELTAEGAGNPADVIPDERLRLIFTCCHPALAPDAQVALTLRLLCGIPTADIARAFLVSRTDHGGADHPGEAEDLHRADPLPDPPACRAARSAARRAGRDPPAVHRRPHGAVGRLPGPRRPGDRALHLARMLSELMPGESEVRGLLALLLVTDARRATRVDAEGRLVRLKDQDRSAWDRSALTEADALIVGCLRAGPPGRYVLQAAIASLYAEAPSYDQTDWPQILVLYDRLLQVWPSPVVALNRTVPMSMVSGPQAALAEVERLERDGRLAGYHYLPAIKADLLSRLGRTGEAAVAYRQALALAANDTERAFLDEQIAGQADRA